jgi:integrase
MPAYKDDTGRWRYRFAFKGKRYSGSPPKGANTKKLAEALEREHIEKLKSNHYTGVMPTVRVFAGQFLDYQKAHTKPSTHHLQSIHLNVHVVPRIGSSNLDEIGKLELDALVIEWSGKKVMPRTMNSRLGTVMRMFSLAAEWKIIPRVPEVSFIKVPKDTVRFFSEEEAHRLLNAAHPRWRSMMLIGLRTGLRIGELRGLQWGDVDFAQSQIHVRRTDPGVRDQPAGAPKGNRGRTAPLTPDALACLRDLLELRRIGKKGPRVAPTEWVWPGVDIWKDQRNRDRPRSEGGCVEAITRAIENAKIEERKGDRLGWHTLRHTYASWLVIRGISLRIVQDLLGHASIRQTERYSHLTPNHAHHAAVASLDFAMVPSQEATKALPPGTGSANDGD